MLPDLAPMLATPGDIAALPDPDVWAYEVKWDGYRSLARVDAAGAVFRSRRGVDLTAAYPELAELAGLVGDQPCILDGEIVALRPDGVSDFGALQNRGNDTGAVAVSYLVFDVLHVGDTSLLPLPYMARRELLETLVDPGRHVRVPETFGSDRALALAASEHLGIEGLVAKRLTSVYRPGRRSPDWLKMKNLLTHDVVVVGWKPGEGRRGGTLGSLLLAVAGADGWECVGSVGTGFTEKMLADALVRLTPLERPDPPGVTGLDDEERRFTRWVEPVLVGEVAFSEWSRTGRLRHPRWRGWRDDVVASDVVRV